jgi:hypothetical protein
MSIKTDMILAKHRFQTGASLGLLALVALRLSDRRLGWDATRQSGMSLVGRPIPPIPP